MSEDPGRKPQQFRNRKIQPQEDALKRCILAMECVRAMKTNKPSTQMTQIQHKIVPEECTWCVTSYKYIKQ